MAEQVKKTTSTVKKTTPTPKKVSENLEKKQEEIVQSQDIMAIIKSMQDEIFALKKEKSELEKAKESPKVVASTEKQKYITVYSLNDGLLNLSTEPRGEGRKFTFKSYGHDHKILPSELRLIVNNHNSFVTEGRFFIDDAEFIDEIGYSDVYAHLIGKKDIEDIVNGKRNETLKETFERITDYQKKLLIDRMIFKCTTSQNYNPETVARLERLANNYIRRINKHTANATKEEIPDWAFVDILGKAKVNNMYDEYGNPRAYGDYDDEDDE